jgi:hypothetical protein
MELFPPNFKREFKEEMEIVFSEMVNEAAGEGKRSLAAVCVQELFDLPILILRTNLEEKRMIKTGAFQPSHFVARGAISFGIGLSFVKEFSVIFTLLFVSAINNRGGWYHVLATTCGCVAAALIGGLLFTSLTNESKQFGWFFIVGLLGWFIPYATLFVQNVSFSDAPLTLKWLLPYLGFGLDGAFLSMAFCVARNKKRTFLLPISITAALAPVLCYLLPKYLQEKFSINSSISNIVFDLLLIIGAILLAGRTNQKNLWNAIIGTISLPIVYYFCIVLPGSLYPHSPITTDNPFNLINMIYWIILWIPEGTLFGLIISLIFRKQQLSIPE